MRHFRLILALLLGGGLLVSSLAVAGQSGAPTGEQLRQWHQAQQVQIEDQNQALQLNTDQIREMQRLLTVNGHDVSSVAGTMNEETRRAICDFQAAEGLSITGTPNEETLRALTMNGDQLEFFGLAPEYGNPEYDNSNCCP